jgi:peptidoglycan/xylan/chitin deacetylase (PgdA/CDA1 family)
VKTCLSIDMDNYAEYRSLIDPRGDLEGPSFYDAVPRFLDQLDRVGSKATFFVIGRDAGANRARIREIVDRGHEVGNHSWSHPYNFRRLARAAKTQQIARSEDAIADVIGERPVGFRTPSGDVDRETHEILIERGYLYDSSLTPTPLMWLFILYGKLFIEHDDYHLGSPRNAFAPPYPYVPRPDKLHRPLPPERWTAPLLLEIPASVVRWNGMPFYATLLRRLGRWSFDWLAAVHSRRHPLHMYFHAVDLMDLGDTSLSEAFERSPGLALPFAERESFVAHVFERMAGLGEAVRLRDLASDTLERHGLRAAA